MSGVIGFRRMGHEMSKVTLKLDRWTRFLLFYGISWKGLSTRGVSAGVQGLDSK